MDYFLYKLKFDGAVHFGQSESALSLYTAADRFRADTLFSALCHTALSLWGEQGVQQLIDQADASELVLSDSMPWRTAEGKDVFYLPKPCVVAEQKRDVPSELRKKMKKLTWIPISGMNEFEASIKGKTLYNPVDEPFGMASERTSAAVADNAEARPYQVGTYHFYPDCGLYIIVGVKEQKQAEQMEKLLTTLGLVGIGGKTSAGYGSFTLKRVLNLSKEADPQAKWLYRALKGKDAKHWLLLTTSLPADHELDQALDGAAYQLVRRGGFVQSSTFAASPVKKETQFFLGAGAMLKKPFSGALYNVASGAHTVVRYAKPMMLGVSF